jgi:hypothetical protein
MQLKLPGINAGKPASGNRHRSSMNRLSVIICLCLFTSAAIATEPGGLRAAIAHHFRAQVERSNRLYHTRIEPPKASALEFSYALTDLNGDGVADALVLLKGQYCGSGGCTLQIYQGGKRGFKFVSASTISREPIHILSEKRFGWHSFTLFVNGRGTKPCNALMRFNGQRYPLNPSLVPCATADVLQSAVTLTLNP